MAVGYQTFFAMTVTLGLPAMVLFAIIGKLDRAQS